MISHLTGTTWHKRYTPVEHEFSYPLAYLQVDIDANNNDYDTGSRLLKFDQNDYIPQYKGSLYQRIGDCLLSHDSPLEFNQVKLITMPKVFGFCFNPVNFYLLIQDGTKVGLIVEINNTFGEKHTYAYSGNPLDVLIRMDKTFHVSPFNNVAGFYEVKISEAAGVVHVDIDLHRDGQMIFKSNLNLKPRAKTISFLDVVRNLPNLLLTTVRIGKQAAILYYVKKMDVYDLPEPQTKYTLKWKKPVFLQRILTGKI